MIELYVADALKMLFTVYVLESLQILVNVLVVTINQSLYHWVLRFHVVYWKLGADVRCRELVSLGSLLESLMDQVLILFDELLICAFLRKNPVQVNSVTESIARQFKDSLFFHQLSCLSINEFSNRNHVGIYVFFSNVIIIELYQRLNVSHVSNDVIRSEGTDANFDEKFSPVLRLFIVDEGYLIDNLPLRESKHTV